MHVTRNSALSGAPAAPAALDQELRDHLEIVDALYRFGLGQDLWDRALLTSSYAADAELDFRPAASKLGVEVPVMVGRESIVDFQRSFHVDRLITTHQVTNPRVEITGDTATLTAIVEAQHVLLADRGKNALLKNLYEVELVRDGARWVIRRIRIDNLWYTGDPLAIFG